MTDNIGYLPNKLPYNITLETLNILKKVADTAGAIKELKGTANLIPNQKILISFFALQEAKTSSEIENIHTTTDELIGLADKTENNNNIIDVLRYKDTIIESYQNIKNRSQNGDLLILNSDIEQINTKILGYESSYRKQAGTKIADSNTMKILHTPPQRYNDILDFMNNLLEYINSTEDDIHPLIKMSIIHYQFEVIHPFFDGNGRTGRILNILYLVLKKFLDFPILYLSSYINKNRKDYYRLLQETRETQNFEPWILYMLEGIEKTSIKTLKTIKDINKTMEYAKRVIKNTPGITYSKDLLECIFSNPYTTASDVELKLGVSRQTAIRYLEALAKQKLYSSASFTILSAKKKKGAESKYYNTKLISLLKDNIK